MSRWSVAIPEPGGSVSQIREVWFFGKMSFSQPRGPPKKVGGFWTLKCIFCQFSVIFYPLIILAVNWQKMHFNGQNQKKWRKRTPIIFWFYMKICPPTFLGGPLGWENDIFSKNRTCLIWRHIFPESLMPPGQFAILGTSGPLFKTVLHFWISKS